MPSSPPLAQAKAFPLCHCGNVMIDETSPHWPQLLGYCQDCADVRCDAYPGACQPGYKDPYED